MKKNSFVSFSLPDKLFGIEKSLLVLFSIPLVVVTMILVSLNLILIPKAKEIGKIREDIEKVNANTNKVNEQNKYLGSVDKEKVKNEADYLNSAVLKDKKSYLLVSVIRGVASRFEYQVESFSLAPGELKDSDKSNMVSDNMTKMPINLLLVGPKEKSLDLILTLEKTLPILFIDKFENKNNAELTTLNLTVSSYYVNDKSNIDTSNITINDLKLSADEESVLKKISEYVKIEESQIGTGSAEFQKYDRPNPFSL